MGNTQHAIIKSIFHISTENSHSKLSFNLFKKKDGWLGDLLTTLLQLPQNLVICIEKGDPINFTQVITILNNPYWKHCQIIKNS